MLAKIYVAEGKENWIKCDQDIIEFRSCWPLLGIELNCKIYHIMDTHTYTCEQKVPNTSGV